MCGIVGLLSLDVNRPVSEALITAMRDTMIHRGPDGGGTWISQNGRVGLGHRRLSIIDLSTAAAQPMCNEDETVWVTFNGEIYNHADVRRELERIGGHTWRTDHSDTEVIIHAYEQWGIDCLHKFRGMFALGIWDGRSRELWLARDRIGEKPLYYSTYGGKFAFASEIKALLADPLRTRAVNEEAFFHYLSFLATPAPQTLFDGIEKLPCGTWLRINEKGEVHKHRYWDVWDHTEPLVGMTDDVIAERILAELRTSVQLRKVGDVPVGVFLSGGIDSSTNAILFAEGDSSRVKTFSIGYDGSYQTYRNELNYARLVANSIGAEHHEKLLDIDDLLDFLPKMAWLQDEPIADPVCVPVYYVSKLARDNGVIVCQVGEGADELFWGYSYWKTMLKLQRLDDWPVPRVLKRAGLGGLRMLGKSESFPYECLRRACMGQPVFWGGAEAFTQEQKLRLLSPRLRKKFSGMTSWEALRPIRDHFERRAWDKSHLNWMSYLDLNLRLPELLLMRVDKMSMGVSLEGRMPFLDHKFVELAMSIPSEVKTRNGNLKHILKRAVHGVIPQAIIDRPKQGFGVPVQEWFVGRLGNETRKTLDKFCRDTDFLDGKEVSKLINTGNAPLVWYLLNFALWWNEFIG